ncbi:hypothetical protein JYU19_02375 [bacterium AH-315-J21]|nr:hypothetical protein [bacterium AH-315-J21]
MPCIGPLNAANIYYDSYHSFEMVTRGVYGYRINGKDKVTYNHFDSYPDVLGASILKYASRFGYSAMYEAAERIKLVDKDEIAEKELAKRYMFYADLNVTDCIFDRWYCLLRNTQGSLHLYHKDLEHMIDAHVLLADSFHCRWAYIINLDDGNFEIYLGSDSDPEAAGRYARLHKEDSDGYHGVKLISVFPLSGLKQRFIHPIIQFLNSYSAAENHKIDSSREVL